MSRINIQNLTVAYVKHNSVPYHTRARALEFSTDVEIRYCRATRIAAK
jgi:hypothetical protein